MLDFFDWKTVLTTDMIHVHCKIRIGYTGVKRTDRVKTKLLE